VQKIPELLAPAGNLEKVRVALAFGADAIYCGVPAFSLRARENSFSLADLRQARLLTRTAGKKIYLTVNIFPRNSDLCRLKNFLQKIDTIGFDAIIFSDAGVWRLLREFCPKTKLHLSVQANSVNAESVKFWLKHDVRRVVLGRELSLREIATICKEVPRMEFEVFVQGAICVAYSGRCLLSQFLTNRDANRGMCTQPCRWKYQLVEEKRPNELLPIEEDVHGSYILNSKDLCLIEKIPQLARAGVTALKIEGRHKSIGYLATVTRAYRNALDDFAARKKFNSQLLDEIATTGNRGFTFGFFDGTQRDLQNFKRSASENPQTFLGLVEKVYNDCALLKPRNRFKVGDLIEVVPPNSGIFKFKVTEIFDEDSASLRVVHGGQNSKVWVKLSKQQLTKILPFTLFRKCYQK